MRSKCKKLSCLKKYSCVISLGTAVFFVKTYMGILLSGLIVLTYLLIGFLTGDFIFLSTIATTLTAIIGALTICWQVKREKDLKEAEFIMNYNTASMGYAGSFEFI